MARKTAAAPTVADIMMKPVLTATPDTTVAEACRILMDSWIRHLPILEDELLVGIVSDRDLRAVRDHATPLSAIMRSPVFVLSPCTPLKQAVRLLRDRRFGAVPVLDGRRLVGITSVLVWSVSRGKEEDMKQILVAALSIALVNLSIPAVGNAADPCPGELTQAKSALKNAQAAFKTGKQVAKNQDIQAPRSQAGAKSQDIQAPRSQDIQAPRSQDIQAPRSQDIQAPRSQDIQAPRSQQDVPVPRAQDIQAPRVNKAAALIRQSEAACKRGDMTQSSAKAKEALGLLK